MTTVTRKALRDLWVAGTLGAIFTALARNLPLLQEAGLPATKAETLDVLLRFAYSLWLLAYFLVSNLDNQAEDPGPADLFFDVVQSIATLWALFWIGFALPGHGHGSDAPVPAIRAISIALLAIALTSLVLFAGRSNIKENGARVAGVILALIIGGTTYSSLPVLAVLYVATAAWFLLCIALWVFIANRSSAVANAA